MKNIIVLILLLSFQGKSQCPTGGDNKNARYQHLDSLKNRTQTSPQIEIISLDSVLVIKNDIGKYKTNQFVKITAYVYSVKYGGAETCNCHTEDKSQLDIHIELVTDLAKGSNKKAMVAEITRFGRQAKSMDYDAIKLLKGKKVELTGWLFFDEEHKQNAINTNPNGTNLWRATCWEIHPILSIKEIK